MKASVTIQSTGEVIEMDVSTPEQLVASYKLVNEYYEAYRKLKNMLLETGMHLLANGTKE